MYPEEGVGGGGRSLVWAFIHTGKDCGDIVDINLPDLCLGLDAGQCDN